MSDKSQIQSIVNAVIDPVQNKPLGDLGCVHGVTLADQVVQFVLEIDPKQAQIYSVVLAEIERRIKLYDANLTVKGVLTAHSAPQTPPDIKPKQNPAQGKTPIQGVKRVIAIASGKGGVGKSTLSANLAVAAAQLGAKVGLLDADVYGPSQPKMFGTNKRPSSADGKRIIPLQVHGVTMMSIGLMMNPDQAVVWRGPMLMGALQQMLFQVDWGELDILFIDLPPGTGDVQLTLAQKTDVAGAIVVSTPQDIALIDARKGIDMFDKIGVPIIGLVENMSTHICSQCGHEEHIFGHGGVAQEAAKMGVPLLGEIPLHIDIRTTADNGAPIVLTQPETAQAKSFIDIAKKLI